MKRGHPSSNGFTIVELLVCIIIVATLAGIAIVGYGAWRHSIASDSVKSDLTQGYSAMKNKLNFSNISYQSSGELSESFKSSPDVVVTVAPSGTGGIPHYSGLNDVQNGVLFYTICGDLVAEGYARGTNNGGQIEQYISACNVYNYNQLQVNSSWSGHNLNIPVSSTALDTIANGINYHDSWRPNRDQHEKDFYNTWNARFLQEGGSYPVKTFWDPWASPGNGVMKSELPQPDSTSESTTGYCVEAYNKSYPSEILHVNQDSAKPTEGSC